MPHDRVQPGPWPRHSRCWERAGGQATHHEPGASRGGGRAGKAADPEPGARNRGGHGDGEHRESGCLGWCRRSGSAGWASPSLDAAARGEQWDAPRHATLLPEQGPRVKLGPCVPRRWREPGRAMGPAALRGNQTAPGHGCGARFLPRPRGPAKEGAEVSRARRRPLRRRQHDVGAQILFFTREGKKKKGEKRGPGLSGRP